MCWGLFFFGGGALGTGPLGLCDGHRLLYVVWVGLCCGNCGWFSCIGGEAGTCGNRISHAYFTVHWVVPVLNGHRPIFMRL